MSVPQFVDFKQTGRFVHVIVNAPPNQVKQV